MSTQAVPQKPLSSTFCCDSCKTFYSIRARGATAKKCTTCANSTKRFRDGNGDVTHPDCRNEWRDQVRDWSGL